MMNDNPATEDLHNIGPVIAAELRAVGIATKSDLERIGSAKALILIKGKSGKGCFHMLYALEGARQGIRWHFLQKEDKAIVRAELAKCCRECDQQV